MKKNYLFIIFLIVYMYACETPKSPKITSEKENPIFNGFNQMIDFKSITPEHIVEATTKSIAQSDKHHEVIYSIPLEEQTFENIMLEIDNINDQLSSAYGMIYLLGYTHPDSAVRSTALDKINVLEKYFNKIQLNEGSIQSNKGLFRKR